MSHAEKDQITSDNRQNYGGSEQVWICFCHLFAPHIKEIGRYGNEATDYNSEKIGIGNIPFDHDCTPLTNDSDIMKNMIDISKASTTLEKKSIKLWWLNMTGEITPAVNQATATLPKMLEALFNWPTESFISVQSLS